MSKQNKSMAYHEQRKVHQANPPLHSPVEHGMSNRDSPTQPSPARPFMYCRS